MRIPRLILWPIIALGALLGAAAVYYNFILDWQGRPYCHKQIMLALLTWAGEGRTNALPNVRGLSWESILAFKDEMAGTNWAQHYRYIPGLRQDDPGDLLLLYMDQPTRWVWHGSPPTVWRKKAWLVVRFDFEGPGECSERVPTAEFTRRLRQTLDFIRTNERPNWQTIVAEHERFLKRVEHEGE
jgi:hypothetical protein